MVNFLFWNIYYKQSYLRTWLDLEVSVGQIPLSDFRPEMNVYVTNKWQKEWDENKDNKP